MFVFFTVCVASVRRLVCDAVGLLISDLLLQLIGRPCVENSGLIVEVHFIPKQVLNDFVHYCRFECEERDRRFLRNVVLEFKCCCNFCIVNHTFIYIWFGTDLSN